MGHRGDFSAQPLDRDRSAHNRAVRLGVSTDAARAKSQTQGRRLSQSIYDGTDVDGLLYMSRLTGMSCVAVYDRAVSAKLAATPVEEIVTRADFVPALMSLNVQLIGPL